MEAVDARQELADLVEAFHARLQWLQAHGVAGVAARPSPRRGLVEQADEAPPAAAPAPEQADPVSPPRPLQAVMSSTAAGEDAPLDRGIRLQQLRQSMGACQRCGLAQGRRNLVFGVGDPEAELLFIGEAPGRDEIFEGEPFVGAAGQLLTKMIEAMGLRREEVYIANIIKCRPPQNRDPALDEVDACEVFLRQQIEIIAPRMIIALGNFAAKTLLRTETGITRLRGRFHTYQGIPLMPTFHPAYLLRNPDGKRPAWQDLKAVMSEMDRLGLRRARS